MKEKLSVRLNNLDGRTLLSVPLLVIVLGIAFWVIMTLVFCIPAQWTSSHARESLDIMVRESGSHEHAALSSAGYYSDFTEYVMLNISVQSSDNPLMAPLESRMDISGGSMGSSESLRSAIDDDGSPSSYPRYWHGYVVVLRPLLCLFDVVQIRMILQVGFFLLVSVLTIRLCVAFAEKGAVASFLIMFSFVSMGATQAAENLPTSFSFIVSIVGCIWVAAQMAKSQIHKYEQLSSQKILYGFMMLGGVTVFFDFLNNPLLTLSVPLALMLFLTEGEISFKSIFATLASAVVGWVVGYVGLWFMKWALSSIFTQTDVFADALGTIAFRTGASDEGAASGSWIDSVLCNINSLDAFRYVMAVVLLLSFLSVIACWLVRRKAARFKSAFLVVASLFVVGLFAYAWFALASNHSIIHHGMTYRTQIGSLFAWLAATAYTARSFKGFAKIECGDCRTVAPRRRV